MWQILSFLSPHDLHVLFYCVLSIFFYNIINPYNNVLCYEYKRFSFFLKVSFSQPCQCLLVLDFTRFSLEISKKSFFFFIFVSFILFVGLFVFMLLVSLLLLLLLLLSLLLLAAVISHYNIFRMNSSSPPIDAHAHGRVLFLLLMNMHTDESSSSYRYTCTLLSPPPPVDAYTNSSIRASPLPPPFFFKHIVNLC